ncbi:hypothetical protein FIU83_15435 [Halomonas sp. THAF5a]|uniref:hypothetical protein n=1 Tax=Halomonas sp. THAF5a TaxID=2587844 RepID=UPI0012A83F10|nr:hypothetical protein [Halomonas sp. THAF5a]QFU03039.1 hypothetical protein FIU83_15435 [Halomonas sp. THAF5a]
MQVTHSTARHDARAWRTALDRALSAHGGADVLARYPHLANAFPAPSSPRQQPLLDYRELKAWATRRGWQVRPAPERAAGEERHHPPVRFIRRPGATARHSH